jgi:hypothetical protein
VRLVLERQTRLSANQTRIIKYIANYRIAKIKVGLAGWAGVGGGVGGWSWKVNNFLVD